MLQPKQWENFLRENCLFVPNITLSCVTYDCVMVNDLRKKRHFNDEGVKNVDMQMEMISSSWQDILGSRRVS